MIDINQARKILSATQEDINDKDLTKLLKFMEQISILLLVNAEVPKKDKV